MARAQPAGRVPLRREIERLKNLRLFLGLDYDGTVVPIRPGPEEADIDTVGRALLQRLAERMPVALISGRALSWIRSRLRLESLIYAGNHGFEIEGPGIRRFVKVPAAWPSDLERVLEEIRSIAPQGVLIEEKGPIASVHYRRVAPGRRPGFLRKVRSRLRPRVDAGRLRLRRGKAVLEICPPILWDKGRALRWLLSRPGLRGRFPIYIGDDRTDEDALRAVGTEGLGIIVAPRRVSAAHRRLPSPAAVRNFLAGLVDL